MNDSDDIYESLRQSRAAADEGDHRRQAAHIKEALEALLASDDSRPIRLRDRALPATQETVDRLNAMLDGHRVTIEQALAIVDGFVTGPLDQPIEHRIHVLREMADAIEERVRGVVEEIERGRQT